MKIKLCMFIVCMIIVSCSKPQNLINNEIEVKNDKKTRAYPVSSILLIPAGYTERVGFICDGYVLPTQSVISNLDIITGVDDQPIPGSPYYFDILNPSGYGGLPNLISGAKLTGIALAELPSYNYPSIYLSYTDGNNHWLFKAKLVGNDYEIVTATVLLTSFAPAAGGWVLHDIELSNNGNLYGLFSDPITHNTILSEIDPIFGNCILKTTFSAMRCCGMDVRLNDVFVLLYEDITATTYGKIIAYNLLTATTSIYPLNISKSNPSYLNNLNWTATGYDQNYFLSLIPGTAYNFTIYNMGNTVENLLKYDISTPGTPASTASNTALWYDITNNTFSSSIIGYVITDAAN